jgi:Xaa-Pro dipeptidase
MRTPEYLFFSLDEYRARLDGLRSRMQARGLDALVVTTPANTYHISGYQTPGNYWYHALIVPAGQEPVFIPPPHEETNVRAFSWVDEYRMYRDTENWMDTTQDVLAGLGLSHARIGLEYDSRFLTARDYLRLTSTMPGATFIDGSGLVEQGRMIKSPREIEYMRHAAKAAVAATKAGMDAARPGVTENEISAEVHRAQILADGEYSGLPVILSSGPRSLLIHQTWSPRVVKQNEVVFFEVPGVFNRYHAAMTRELYLGDPPPLAVKVCEASSAILAQVKSMIRPGVVVSQVFEEAKRLVEASVASYAQFRRIAYSIGIAFPPGWDEGHIISINANEHREFQAGMTFHVLVTMHRPEYGGLGFSDTVLVTETGCETLTAGLEPKLYVR